MSPDPFVLFQNGTGMNGKGLLVWQYHAYLRSEITSEGAVVSLNTTSERAIQRMVERWDLHTSISYSLPVPIAQVARNEGWTVRYIEGLFPLYGFAAVRGYKRLMGINADVARTYQRMAIAHEMGHIINGDAAHLHFCSEWEWLYSKQERRASEVAAQILIPAAALREIATIDEIAAMCDVPVELVEIRVGER